MEHKTYHWKTKDKKKLFVNCWRSENEKGITILFIHGLGEHSGRYEHWAEKFTKKGYNFLSFDIRGHGKSSGIRGHARSLDTILHDVDLLFHKAEEMFPEQKFILYGHSMGGSIALNHVIRVNKPVSALIVTSPWLKMFKEPPYPIISLISLLNKFIPHLTIKVPFNPEQISHDPEVVKKYKNDPLIHNKISIRLFHEMYYGGYHALRNVYKINYPFLLMHGSEDKITSHKASENYVMNTSERTSLKLWDGQYHELHNEFVQDEVFNYIIQWLNKFQL